jgi:hypothetical protein
MPTASTVKGGVKNWTLCMPPVTYVPLTPLIPKPNAGEKVRFGVTMAAGGESKFGRAAEATGPFTVQSLVFRLVSCVKSKVWGWAVDVGADGELPFKITLFSRSEPASAVFVPLPVCICPRVSKRAFMLRTRNKTAVNTAKHSIRWLKIHFIGGSVLSHSRRRCCTASKKSTPRKYTTRSTTPREEGALMVAQISLGDRKSSMSKATALKN